MGTVQGSTQQITLSRRLSGIARYVLLAIPLLFLAVFFLLPLGLTILVGFFERAGFWIRPAFTLAAYQAFLGGPRLFVLQRSLFVAAEVTVLALALAYPMAYFLSMHVRPQVTRTVLLLFTVPFVVNYVIRNFSWAYLLSRTGPVNRLLEALHLTAGSLDWLLYSDFSVLVGLISSYMPFMIYPLWLALAGVDRRLIEASWVLGAPPLLTFLRVTLPLSIPGIFTALIFGFVGSFGESAVPIILGGVGYQLMGNTITSALDVLNYPLAAAMSSIVVVVMLLFLAAWYLLFDVPAFLGKIVRWRV
ncbi:MAG: ABC transporter permease [Armatimonadota bacterium]|nr:ABC transporter permease [Armatimonadota bacterium]MDR7450335.1 ABC transporter permease [Armatimonadota bacterium]MDR7467082.1 ABC transporter permease [Armatimonadota bacterium]MDR7493376.1 ABC transporter permease [Armatimonadota bacterium]MDR7499384.1 ABC transporter permease [Armatimonadota bacterium]